MLQCIARIFEPLLRLLYPATGRHRAGCACPVRRGRHAGVRGGRRVGVAW